MEVRVRHLLDALQEGRLIELPTTDKLKALEYLAVLIEAVPGIAKMDIVQGVLDREEQGNTGLDKGIACPHLRVHQECDMVCAVGWSKQGIDYGAPDGLPVHLVIMYYVPDSQRNTYLKEISALAKSVLSVANGTPYQEAADIHSIRNKLLDWVEDALSRALPDAKARMIRIEAKHAAGPLVPESALLPLPAWDITPFILIAFENGECKVLAQEMALAVDIERDYASSIVNHNGQLPPEIGGYRIVITSQSAYSLGRIVYNCVAIRSKELKPAS